MTLWFILAMMTAVALAAVAWPLARGRRLASGVSDVAVYRDQLEEIERDRADGRIGHDEFEAARVEVSRRLLGAAGAATSLPAAAPPRRSLRIAAFAGAIVAVPLIAVPFYRLLGSPGLPGEPLADRDVRTSIMALVARIERHLEENPNDGKGWEVLAPVYLKMERYDDAAKARRNALNLLGDTAQREVDLGAALAMAAGGVVTAEAKGAFDRAAAIEPGNFQAMFFLGIAAQQDGNEAEAVSIWRDLLAKGPADSPWLPLVRERLARINPDAAPAGPGPTAADVAAAQDMPPDARAQFISTMVGRLASRLHEDGSDVDGWLRLLRAYRVMGERDKARTAVSEAREALAHEPEKLKLFDAGLQDLGVEE
jgi:cytochrome c-type biogenesis protein CcmH